MVLRVKASTSVATQIEPSDGPWARAKAASVATSDVGLAGSGSALWNQSRVNECS